MSSLTGSANVAAYAPIGLDIGYFYRENRDQSYEIENARCPDQTAELVKNGALTTWQRKKVLQHIEDNLSETLKIEQIARLVKLSSSHFTRGFKADFGITPYNYILARRMKLASDLIQTGELRLSEIALECGMTDQAHLCKVFRKAYGTTPKSWRRAVVPAIAAALH
jgi:AraC family transcriptional regulator